MKILRWVFVVALGLQAGCGLTLDLDPDADSSVDGGMVDASSDGAVDDAADGEVDSGTPDGSGDAMPDPDMGTVCVEDSDCVPLGMCAECNVAGFCEVGSEFLNASPLTDDGVSLDYCDDARGRETLVIDGPAAAECVPGQPGCLVVSEAAPGAIDVCEGLDNEDCVEHDVEDCTHFVFGSRHDTETMHWADLMMADPPLQDGSVVCFVAISTAAHCRGANGWTVEDAMPTGLDITLLGGLRRLPFQERIRECTEEGPPVEMFETTTVTSHIQVESLHVRGPFDVAAGGYLDLRSSSIIGTTEPIDYLIQVKGTFTAYGSHIEDRAPDRNLIETDNAALTIVASELVRGQDGFAIHATNSDVTLQNNCSRTGDGCEPEVLAIGGHSERPGIFGQGGASALYMDGGQLSAVHNVFVSVRVRSEETPTVDLRIPRSASLKSNWIGNYGGSIGLRVDECGEPTACVSEQNTVLMVPARATGLIAAPAIRGASISGAWSFQGDEIGVLGINPAIDEAIGVRCEANSDGEGCVFRGGAYLGAIQVDDIPDFWADRLGAGWSFAAHRPALSIGIQCDGCTSLTNLDANGGTAMPTDATDTFGVGIRIVDSPVEGTVLSGVRAVGGAAITQATGLETQNGLTIVINSTMFGGEALVSRGLWADSTVWLRNATAVGGTNQPTQRCTGASLPANSVVLSSLLIGFCPDGVGLAATGMPRIVLDTGFISLPGGMPHRNLPDAIPLIDSGTFVTLGDLNDFYGDDIGLHPCAGTTAVGASLYNTHTDQEGDLRMEPPALGALRRDGTCAMAGM